MKRVIVQLHVLKAIADNQPLSGYQIAMDAGYRRSQGSVYAILDSLEKLELIEAREIEIDRQFTKFRGAYQLTPWGKTVYGKWKHLLDEPEAA